MEKEMDKFLATVQQNKLLREQNALLLDRIEFLESSKSSRRDDGREIFIENIDRDEMRSGFLVTNDRKKLWNVQIGIMQEFARICKKHNLQWFAYAGTALGAVRHKGFIPWDFDIDLAMFRPEYNKFLQIAAKEVKAPYFFDNWYDYRLESEGASFDDPEGSYQFVTKKQQATYPNHWLTQWPSFRIRDNRTTMIEVRNRNYINQGIWIDVFPIDALPPFDTKKEALNFEVARLLALATAAPAWVKKAIQEKQPLAMDYDILEKFLSKPYKKRGEIFDDFINKKFLMSDCVGEIRGFSITRDQRYFHSKDFRDLIYLPFEKIEVPVPVGYESYLNDFFGDWHKLVIYPEHVVLHSADIPYKEYFQKTFFK